MRFEKSRYRTFATMALLVALITVTFVLQGHQCYGAKVCYPRGPLIPEGNFIIRDWCNAVVQSTQSLLDSGRACNKFDADIGQQCVTDFNGTFCDSKCNRESICFAPEDAAAVNVTLTLLNRVHPGGKLVDWRSGGQLLSSKDTLTSGRTFVIVNGFLSGPLDPNPDSTIRALRRSHPEANVLVFLWYNLNKSPLTAFQNVRLAGPMLGHFLVKADIVETTNCVGFSLGGHVCGEAGKFIISRYGKVLDEITGLDIGGLSFKGCSEHVKLTRRDARQVTIWHTSSDAKRVSSTVGQMPENNGHTDIHFSRYTYAPGILVNPFEFLSSGPCGARQPACRSVTGITSTILGHITAVDVRSTALSLMLPCDHVIVWKYFASAIENECFVAKRPANKRELEPYTRQCSGRTVGDGFALPSFRDAPHGVFFVQPGVQAPRYCPGY